jgi:hypothetical protein
MTPKTATGMYIIWALFGPGLFGGMPMMSGLGCETTNEALVCKW